MDTNEGIRAKDILPHKKSFSPGDGFYGDGPQSFFMEADVLKQNVLGKNVVQDFDPERTENNKYEPNESVCYNGKIYTFNIPHYGPWTGDDVSVGFSVDQKKLHDIMNDGYLDISSSFVWDSDHQIIAFEGNVNFGVSLQVDNASMESCRFVDISGYTQLEIVCIVRSYSAAAFSGLVFYDANKNPIEGHYITDDAISLNQGYSVVKTFSIPSSAKYVRTTRFMSESPLGSNTIKFYCRAFGTNVQRVIGANDTLNITDRFIFRLYNQIIASESASTYGQSVATDDQSMVASDYVDISGYTQLEIVCIVRSYSVAAFSGLVFYDANKNPIEGHYITDKDVGADSGYTAAKKIDIPAMAKYVRTTLFSSNSPLGSNTIGFYCHARTVTVSGLDESIKNVQSGCVINITYKFNFEQYYQIIASESASTYGQSLETDDQSMVASDYVDISGYTQLEIVCIVRSYSVAAFSGLVFYDENKNPVKGYYFTDAGVAANAGYSVSKTFDIPVEAKYIRTTLFSSNSPLGSNTVGFYCNALKSSVFNNKKRIDDISDGNICDITYKFNFTRYDQIIASELANTYGQSVATDNQSMEATDFVDIGIFSAIEIVCMVRPYSTGAFSGLVFYDENKEPIEGHYFTDNSIAVDQGYSVVKNFAVPALARYVRTTRFSSNSPLGSNTIDFYCKASVKSIKNFYEFAEPSLLFHNRGYSDFEIISVPNYPHHDTTYCRTTEEVYAFNKPQDGVSKIYTKDFEFIKDINVSFYETFKDNSHDYLQMKSVDCNWRNNCLLVGNGQWNYRDNDGYIYLFYDFLNWKNINGQVNFNNCGRYIKYDFTELGVCIYGFWAGSNETNDVIIVNSNQMKDYYFVHLGKGVNQLGKGSYIEGATDTEYNGTWEILSHFEAPYASQFVEKNQDDAVWPHGGQYYRGSLYIASDDHNTCEVFKITFIPNGSAKGFAKIDTIVAESYIPSGSYKGEKRYSFLDGMFIRDGYIYSAPLNVDGHYHTGTNKVVLKIEIPL